MSSILDRIATEPVLTRNTAILRCGLGALGLLYHLIHYRERALLFGPEAVWSQPAFLESISESQTFSLYVLAQNSFTFELIFHLGIIAAVGCMLGIGGRISIAFHYVFIWSLYQRNPALLDGGDNLVYLLLPMLMLTRSTDYFAVWTRRSKGNRFGGVMLHNFGVMLIVAQVLSLYTVSGLYKVGGDLWMNGTALYYVLRTPEFMASPFNSIIITNAAMVTIGTYAAMILLVSMPLLVLNPRTREPALVCAILFHLSIAVFMGLWGFALTMILCDVVLLPERRLEWLLDAVRPTRRDEASAPLPGEASAAVVAVGG